MKQIFYTTLFFLTALTSEAQYRKVYHGDVVNIEEGVLVGIEDYRRETLLMQSQKALIDSLLMDIVNYDVMVVMLESQVDLCDKINDAQREDYSQKLADQRRKRFSGYLKAAGVGIVIGLLL